MRVPHSPEELTTLYKEREQTSMPGRKMEHAVGQRRLIFRASKDRTQAIP
jgi:hypothetical protein